MKATLTVCPPAVIPAHAGIQECAPPPSFPHTQESRGVPPRRHSRTRKNPGPWWGAVWLAVCMLSVPLVVSADHPALERDPAPMVMIPQGDFMRGSPANTGRADERPSQRIYLDAFLIDKHEVTNQQYLAFVTATGHKEPFNVYGDGSLFNVPGIDTLPVVQITWHDAADYCQWVGKRLPTEAEWEKAARGTDGRNYPWGDSQPSPGSVNFKRDWADTRTLLPAGSLPDGASPYGVQDMSGNAREWVQDWYAKDYYQTASTHNPKGPETGLLKVIRGGSWHSSASDIRTGARGKGGFALKTHGTGFRCAKDVPVPPQDSAHDPR